MSGLIGYIGALADDLSAVAAKVAAGSLDDIANQTAKSLSKTAGILIDDTATIPQYVSNTAAKREIPVIWKITKKSLRNKAIMIPIAILITYFAPWIMAPILILGGSYLAYEGTESLGEKLGLIKPHEHTREHSIPNTNDLTAAEDITVNSAVRTDTILSIEIIALTIASVATESLSTQLGVLIIVGLIATFAVYGIVGMIIKMDDVGFYLQEKQNKLYQAIGSFLIRAMPKILKSLGWIGMVAMLMVGGSIIIHNIDQLHFLVILGHNLPSILPLAMKLFFVPIGISLAVGSLIIMSILKFQQRYA
ncbi:Membrane protein, putative [uncultured Candidatus Thioglobus sp.]|nr:Membrane protein, putative [uncultured Candidatus Thioglobus sp.]